MIDETVSGALKPIIRANAALFAIRTSATQTGLTPPNLLAQLRCRSMRATADDCKKWRSYSELDVQIYFGQPHPRSSGREVRGEVAMGNAIRTDEATHAAALAEGQGCGSRIG